MARYYVNRKAQPNGDHEVHKAGCAIMTYKPNRMYLGDFPSCREAVREAEKHYSRVNGCYRCSEACHERRS